MGRKTPIVMRLLVFTLILTVSSSFYDCSVGDECSALDGGKECLTDLDCTPGHICQESGKCTETQIKTFQDCIKVRPLLQANHFFDRSRYSVFLIVSGRQTTDFWKTQITNLVSDIDRGNCTDYYFRLVVPSSNTPEGARFVDLTSNGRTVVSKKDGALDTIIINSISSLPVTPESPPELLKVGLWAIQQISSAAIDEQTSGVMVYILADSDDCSSNLPSPDCGNSQDLVDVTKLGESFKDAATIIRASSSQYRWGTILETTIAVVIAAPGVNGCSIGGASYPAAPRFDQFIQYISGNPSVTGQSHSWCSPNWGGGVVTPECNGDVANPAGFGFPILPISLDLVAVRSNGVLVSPSKIRYLWRHNGYDQENVFPTSEDIWNGFDKNIKQMLTITGFDGLDKGGIGWDDFINVLFCPLYHTQNPFSLESALATPFY